MAFASMTYPSDKNARYDLLAQQLASLTEGVAHPMVNLSNAAALLWQGLPDINWCGFYLMHHGALLLGPFCGLPACTRIPLGRGVCGTAAQEDAVQRVDDVHAFPGHIACDSASRSEIVIPIHHEGRVIGVLDIDSPVLNRFDEIDQRRLGELVRRIEECCDFLCTGYSLT